MIKVGNSPMHVNCPGKLKIRTFLADPKIFTVVVHINTWLILGCFILHIRWLSCHLLLLSWMHLFYSHGAIAWIKILVIAVSIDSWSLQISVIWDTSYFFLHDILFIYLLKLYSAEYRVEMCAWITKTKHRRIKKCTEGTLTSCASAQKTIYLIIIKLYT